jgi:hypothetical protein
MNGELSVSGSPAAYLHKVSGMQQDTLALTPPLPENRSIQLNVPVSKPRIDSERAQKIIERTEQREQEIQTQRRRITAPRIEALRQPSIEIDTLMAKYRHTGCLRPVSFPDNSILTILERYYQPMTTAFLPGLQSAAATDSLSSNTDSLFIVKQETAINVRFGGENRPTGYPSVITVFLIGAFIFFAWIRFHFGICVSRIVQSFFNYRQACRIFGERREVDRQASFFTNILFIYVSGIFLALYLPFRLWNSYSLSVLLFAVTISMVYALKSGIWKTLGNIFMVQPFSREYVYHLHLFNNITGLFILPFVAAIPFTGPDIALYLEYTVIFIFCVSYLLRICRIFQIIRTQNVSIFYFILYLCALEILPLLLLVKTCKILNAHIVM